MQTNQTSTGTLRFIAAAELLLILPAAVFMTSLFVRSVMRPELGPAQAAQFLVDWYGARPLVGLDLFLIAMPLAVFVLGFASALGRWKRDAALRQAARETMAAVRAHLSTLLIAGATVASGCILVIVALHVISG